jgi:hypothetical protein
MPDYTLGKIYIIQSPHTDKCYIGSTAQPLLCSRMSCHRTNAKLNDRSCTSKIVIDAGDAFITLIEKYPCADRTELNRREGIIAQGFQNIVNKQVAGRTRTETQHAYNNKPEIKASKKAIYQTPTGRASANAAQKTYNNKPEIIALKSNREYMDHQNKMARARTAKKRDAKKAAALLTA